MLQSTCHNETYEKQGMQSKAPYNDLKRVAPGCSLSKAQSPPTVLMLISRRQKYSFVALA